MVQKKEEADEIKRQMKMRSPSTRVLNDGHHDGGATTVQQELTSRSSQQPNTLAPNVSTRRADQSNHADAV
jgi:hypothetical protein